MMATMATAAALPRWFMLDGPLFAACCLEEAELRDCAPEDLPRLDPREVLPLAIERSGQHWVSRTSAAQYEVAARDTAHWTKRFDLDDALGYLEADRSVSLKSGTYRLQRQPLYLEVTGEIVWHVMGEGEAVERLLTRHVRGLGKKRGYGLGRVLRWRVEPCAEDLSLRRADGALARPVPLLHKRLGKLVEASAVAQIQANPPYWTGHYPEACAVAGRWKGAA